MDDLVSAPSTTADRAREVVEKWGSPALVNHCLRSWVWATRLAETMGLDYDAELLYVAAMLHDLGVTPHFDAHEIAFEDAGGAVAWSFATAAGWSSKRRDRVEEVIQRHAWAVVDVEEDVEGFLLEAATSLDVAASGANRWDSAFLVGVAASIPRLNFAAEFGAVIAEQARRKPTSEAARFNKGTGAVGGETFWSKLS